MSRTVLAASLAFAVLLSPSSGAADNAADFSGTWKMDATRSESAHSTDASGPVTLVIKQNATELSVENRRGDVTETLVYKLDGSKTEKPAEDNGPFQWSAKREGAKVALETHRNVNKATVTLTEILSLDGGGKELVVDRTLTVQHGYTMRGAKNYSSGKDVFVKAP